MERLGYERLAGLPVLAPLRYYASLPLAVVRAYRANRSRMGNPVQFLWRRLRPMLGS
ncbi:MAG: hypothetical protein KatS3mg103_0103 [Phycisphaerales bacterium]|nr:MAG: hypothetical protein KatS3mg103_0103 [Phycisphaerales bacterium]